MNQNPHNIETMSLTNSTKNNTMANLGKVQNTSPLRIQRLKETMNLTR
jgi:hypothetical protein